MQYIDHIWTLCKRLYINQKANLYHFTNGYKHPLREALVLLEPPNPLTKERQLENEIWSVPELFFFFKKKLYVSWKEMVCSLVWRFWQSSTWTYHKSKLYDTFDSWFRDMLDFVFSEKGLQIVSLAHFLCYFSGKIPHIFLFY